MTQCPRCGYPEVGPRVPAMQAWELICLPCSLVEGQEMAQLQRVLPFELWAVND